MLPKGSTKEILSIKELKPWNLVESSGRSFQTLISSWLFRFSQLTVW